MFTRNVRLPRTVVAVALAAGLSIAGSLPAFADETTVVVTGGTLTMTTPLTGNFAGVTITGQDQVTTATTDAFSVSDLRGSGAGWHITAQATQLSDGAITPKTLAAGSLTMSAPTVDSPNTSSPDPTGLGAYVIDNGAATIATAAIDAGMGTYDFSQTTMTLAIPADVKAASYTSTVTLSVVTGP